MPLVQIMRVASLVHAKMVSLEMAKKHVLHHVKLGSSLTEKLVLTLMNVRQV